MSWLLKQMKSELVSTVSKWTYSQQSIKIGDLVPFLHVCDVCMLHIPDVLFSLSRKF